MVKGKKIALAFRAVSLIVAVAGFLSMTGAFGGGLQPQILMYYTMQSNIMAIVMFAMLTARTAIGIRRKENSHAGYFQRFGMVCAIDILLTFGVFWALLAPRLFTMGDGFPMWSFANLAVHGITPLLCLLDYILFTQPRHLKYRDVYYVCIFPIAYLVGTALAGLLGYVYMVSPDDGAPVRFPYFFYDFDRIGAASLIYIGALIAFFLLVSHGFYFVDKKARKQR